MTNLEGISSKLPLYLFAGLGLISSTLFSFQLIDPTLMIRQTMLAFWVAVLLLLFSVKDRNKSINFNIFIVLFAGFILYAIGSLIWTFNLSLGIISVSKFFTLFAYLTLFQYFIQRYKDSFLPVFIVFNSGLFLISLIPMIYTLTQINGFSRESMYDVFTLSGHKNLYSSFVFLSSVFTLIGLSCFAKLGKILLIFVMILQLLVVAILQSRAVVIGYTMFFFITGFLYGIHKWSGLLKLKTIWIPVLSSVVLLNLFFLFIFPQAMSYYLASSGTDGLVDSGSTLWERIMVWEKTYLVVFDNFLTGVGGGNWRVFYPSFSVPEVYKVTDLHSVFQRPHNDFLGILSEYGWIGFNLFYAFIIGIVISLYKNLAESFDWKHLITISGILGYLTISFFSFPGERIEHGILLMSLLGVASYWVMDEELTFFTLKMNKLWIVGLIAFLAFGFSGINMKGEYFTRKYLIEKAKGNFQKVIEYGQQAESIAYTLDPTSMPVSWYMGNAYIKQNKNQQALIDFERAYSQNPFNHFVLNDLGSAYYVVGQMENAKVFFEKSATINPRFDDPKLNLAAIYINEGNYIKAEEWCRSLLHDSERRSYYQDIIIKNK